MPANDIRRTRLAKVGAVTAVAFVGLFGWEIGRAGAGGDPAIPAATASATPSATADSATVDPAPADPGVLTPPSDPQGPTTRSS